MSTLRIILQSQLTETISSLDEIDKNLDSVMMCEAKEEFTHVPHHPIKIAFLISAMRFFAQDLKNKGYKVRHIPLDTEGGCNNLDEEVKKAIQELKPDSIVITEPYDWRVLEKVQRWQQKFSIKVEIRSDKRFLCSIEEFKKWASDKKSLLMEPFYRMMRKKYNILMDMDGKPTGGLWNYDKENRDPPDADMTIPPRLTHVTNDTVRDVISLVGKNFQNHFGSLEQFDLATTRNQALEEAHFFIDNFLPSFGKYQDVMISGEAYLYHSRLSPYLNAGLLMPLELCKLAQDAYRNGKAPLNAAEGFIRQILGWREYVRGIYWNFMPTYAKMNYFEATNPLPSFYWGKPTKMFCIKEAVSHTQRFAYSHHIQRLMVTGNFALLAGINPREVEEWYLAVYADAYEWVELPNTLGMALFGDGGIMASKPYAASGKYISRMSNFCKKCHYNPNKLTGEDACPFNALYWHFFMRHESKLKNNTRLAFAYLSLKKFDNEKKQSIIEQADKVINLMNKGLL